MVLTNFECWAHGGSDNLSVGDLIERRATSVDLFNPAAAAALQQTCNGLNTANGACGELKNVSHLSSNGYYGFVSCNVNNTAGTETSKITGGDSGNDNNDVRCSEHAVGATKNGSATVNTTNSAAGVHDDTMDTMMDVEQHPNVVSAVSRCDMVDAMFLQCAPNLPEVSIAAGGNNGFDKRKRLFASDDTDLIGMGGEAVKRFRHEEGNHWINADSDKNISLSYFAVHDDTHSAMDHDDIPAEKQTVLNYPESNLVHYEHLSQPVAIEQPPFHQIDPKRKHSSTHILDINKINKKPLIDHSIMVKSFNKLPSTAHEKNRIRISHSNDPVHLQFDCKPMQSHHISENMIKNRFGHFTEDTIDRLKCTNANLDVDDEIHKYQNDRDDLLENLFLSLHGGGNRHVWRHLSNCIGGDEEI